MDKERDTIATRLSSAVQVAEDDCASHGGNKPLQEIEENIARTRVRLSATIEALERELAPRRVVENAVDVLRESFKPSVDPSRDQAATYAIPLALIAACLGWLFIARRRNWQGGRISPLPESASRCGQAGEIPGSAIRSQKVEDSFAR